MNASETYRVSFGNRIGRGVIRVVGGLLYRALARVTITGLENIPAHGAYLIAFNHISIFEPPFLLTL